MAYTNPTKFGGSSVKSWNSETKDMRLGFAIRDKLTTEANSTPMVIPKLGMSYQQYAQLESQPSPVQKPERYAQWTATGGATVPGIMALTFEPIFAQGGPSFIPAEMRDIFTNVWTQMRIVNNMTKNFQAQDLQLVYCGLAEILCHVANARRILNIAQRCINHELNQYFDGETLLSMLGFNMSKAEMRQNWEAWWRKFNVDVLDQLRRIKWLDMESLMPGLHRWEGLCSEIYKDTSENTDYCQLYVFKRKTIWILSSVYDTEQSAFVWTFTSNGVGSLTPGAGVGDFTTYLENIVKAIRSLFWDEGTATILATINTIIERKMGEQISASYIDIPNLPFEGEEIKLTWDFDMMLAIHNATICDVNVLPPQQDIANERLTQLIYSNHRNRSNLVEGSGDALLVAPKILNLPNFGVSTEDIINALQWSVTTRPGSSFGPDDRILLTDGAYGTDIITCAEIGYYNYGSTFGAGTFTFSTRYSNLITSKDFDLYAEATMRKIAMWHCFEFAPMLYFAESNIDPLLPDYISYVNAPLEVQYLVTEPICRIQHNQFVRNFWGYPGKPAEIGSFNTSYDDRNSDRK